MVVKFDDNNKKITATTDVLNLISMVFREAADEMIRNGYTATAGMYERYADEIFKQLEEAGVYADYM